MLDAIYDIWILRTILQVRNSKNEALGTAVFESMHQPSSRLGLCFRSAQLLQLLQPQAILKIVLEDPDVLFQLAWKHLAMRHPGITVQLMQQALETADGEVALRKRWQLVRDISLVA